MGGGKLCCCTGDRLSEIKPILPNEIQLNKSIIDNIIHSTRTEEMENKKTKKWKQFCAVSPKNWNPIQSFKASQLRIRTKSFKSKCYKSRAEPSSDFSSEQ